MLSCVRIFANPRTVACQDPLSLEFFKQEYRNRLPFPLSGDLPDPGVKPPSLAFPALAGRLFMSEPPGKSLHKGTNPIFEGSTLMT